MGGGWRVVCPSSITTITTITTTGGSNQKRGGPLSHNAPIHQNSASRGCLSYVNEQTPYLMHAKMTRHQYLHVSESGDVNLIDHLNR